MASLEELPPSLRVLLKAEAIKRNVEPEILLEKILSGENPIPWHVAELVRNVSRKSNAE